MHPVIVTYTVEVSVSTLFYSKALKLSFSEINFDINKAMLVNTVDYI